MTESEEEKAAREKAKQEAERDRQHVLKALDVLEVLLGNYTASKAKTALELIVFAAALKKLEETFAAIEKKQADFEKRLAKLEARG